MVLPIFGCWELSSEDAASCLFFFFPAQGSLTLSAGKLGDSPAQQIYHVWMRHCFSDWSWPLGWTGSLRLLDKASHGYSGRARRLGSKQALLTGHKSKAWLKQTYRFSCCTLSFRGSFPDEHVPGLSGLFKPILVQDLELYAQVSFPDPQVGSEKYEC